MNTLVKLGSLLAIITFFSTYPHSAETRPPSPSARLPERLESYLSTIVRPAASERKKLLSGAPITKFLEADRNYEVAVFGAVWINASPHRYIETIKDIENFERGGPFKVTRRISAPPKLEDFAELKLTQDDFEDLRKCRVGKCELKLDQFAIESIRTKVDWQKPAAKAEVEQILRQLAYNYVNEYRANGNRGLAVYRDQSRPTFVANEFKSMVDRMPELTTYLPELRKYLLEYPHAALSNSTDFLYWQEVLFGLKPTVRINHLIIHDGAEETVVASKMLYASHYFWTALELRVLVPDPSRGTGFWLVIVNRGRSDGLEGFTGRLIRGRVRDEAQEAVLAGLTSTKTKLESKAH